MLSGWRVVWKRKYDTVFSWIFHWETVHPVPESRYHCQILGLPWTWHSHASGFKTNQIFVSRWYNLPALWWDSDFILVNIHATHLAQTLFHWKQSLRIIDELITIMDNFICDRAGLRRMPKTKLKRTDKKAWHLNSWNCVYPSKLRLPHPFVTYWCAALK